MKETVSINLIKYQNIKIKISKYQTKNRLKYNLITIILKKKKKKKLIHHQKVIRKKIILSNIYRSPNPLANITQSEHLDNFISYLDTHLHNLSLKNYDSYVFLDANINLLNINHNQHVALYLETVYSNGYLQKN